MTPEVQHDCGSCFGRRKDLAETQKICTGLYQRMDQIGYIADLALMNTELDHSQRKAAWDIRTLTQTAIDTNAQVPTKTAATGPFASSFKNTMSPQKDQLIKLFTDLQKEAHANSFNKGFWQPHDFLVGINPEGQHRAGMLIAWKLSRIALMHSELSECLEGIRKDLPDDHLPNRSMEVCELADTVIRILDYAGAYQLPLMEVILEKMAYNGTREFMHGKKA